MVGSKTCSGPYLDEFIFQKQSTVERPYLDDLIVGVASVSSEPPPDGHIKTHIESLCFGPGNAVRKDDSGA